MAIQWYSQRHGHDHRDQFSTDRRRKAAITGDFVALAGESASSKLGQRHRGHRIHNHMLDDDPARSSFILG